jgi:replicative DNA helicase
VLAAMRGVTVAPGTWLFVDYLQAIRSGDPRGRHAELSDSLAAIKGEADRLGARLIVASQQNREGIREGRGDGGPRLASLKETGDAEVMAEAVAILWCKDKHVDRQDHGLDCMELHVVKAKNGRRGVVPLRWDGPRTHYEEAST